MRQMELLLVALKQDLTEGPGLLVALIGHQQEELVSTGKEM